MKKEYDFGHGKARPNPYAARLKQPVVLDLPPEVLAWFLALEAETGIARSDLILMSLRDCAREHWAPGLETQTPIGRKVG